MRADLAPSRPAPDRITIDISDRRLELAAVFGAEVRINARSDGVLARVTEITGAGHYRWGSQAAWGSPEPRARDS